MKKLGLLVLVLSLLCGLVGAFSYNGIVYPFPIDNQLVCYEVNPFKDQPGELPSKLSSIPDIPFGLPVPNSQTDPVSQNWLPQKSGFRLPQGRLDEDKLLQFLGADFNGNLTSVKRPPVGAVPQKACDILPAVEGSAGQQRVHVETVQEVINLIALDNDDGTTNSIVYNETFRLDNTTSLIDASTQFRRIDFERLFEVVDQTNGIDELCDIWIAKCPLTPRWMELPDNYFPYYIAQSTCSQKNCSFPRGLTCQEDFTYQVHVTVLRWDCCFNGIELIPVWECGWRKVRVPIFCDCTCGCNEVR